MARNNHAGVAHNNPNLVYAIWKLVVDNKQELPEIPPIEHPPEDSSKGSSEDLSYPSGLFFYEAPSPSSKTIAILPIDRNLPPDVFLRQLDLLAANSDTVLYPGSSDHLFEGIGIEPETGEYVVVEPKPDSLVHRLIRAISPRTYLPKGYRLQQRVRGITEQLERERSSHNGQLERERSSHNGQLGGEPSSPLQDMQANNLTPFYLPPFKTHIRGEAMIGDSRRIGLLCPMDVFPDINTFVQKHLGYTYNPDVFKYFGHQAL